MPAYRERVYVCPDQSGQPIWIGDFPVWWDRAAFFKKYGSRQIDTGNPVYVDYGLLLTRVEAHAWDAQAREAFERDPRSQRGEARQALREWDMAIKSAKWVIVESYEWESGLE